MGFLDFLKKKEDVQQAPVWPAIIGAECKGTVVPMENIPDEVFSQGILGQCIGIDPAEGKVFAPVDGEITQAPDSGHALGLMSTGGVEVLIHVGVDTVDMNGDGFTPRVKEGDKVKKGQLLGFVGDTGYGPVGTSGVMAPHLHFGMYEGDFMRAVNPYPMLRHWQKNS